MIILKILKVSFFVPRCYKFIGHHLNALHYFVQKIKNKNKKKSGKKMFETKMYHSALIRALFKKQFFYSFFSVAQVLALRKKFVVCLFFVFVR